MTPLQNHLTEVVLMMDHNILSLRNEEKISINYPCYPFFSGPLVYGTTVKPVIKTPLIAKTCLKKPKCHILVVFSV